VKLLVVCLGNICRSPMGEGALRAQLARSTLAGTVSVDSAGTAGWHEGRAPDARAQSCALRHGVDIAQLRARQLTAADFSTHRWILCADADNLAAARALAPQGLENRAVLWLDWAGVTPQGSVPDPYYGDEAGFEAVWSLLERAAAASVQRLAR
jgi:protein-tyrosine phosphatase